MDGNVTIPTVDALTVFDDGSGPALHAGGNFTIAGGLSASRIARWNGSSWSALGSGTNDRIGALAVFDDGTGPALYAGGHFGSAIDSGDSYLARWGCGVDSVPPVLCCPLAVFAVDALTGPPGKSVHFTVTASDDVDPSPLILCDPPSGSFFPRGTTIVTCTATDASGNQSTCEFPVTVQIRAREH